MKAVFVCSLLAVGLAIPGSLTRGLTSPSPNTAKHLFDASDANMTSVSVWPQPMNFTTQNGHTYFLNPAAFAFKAVGPAAASDVLSSAFQRYHGLTFAWGAGEPGNAPAPVAPDTFALGGLTVNVLSADETLGRATNESYTLNITDDGTNAIATLTAETVFGALRGLETFSQLAQYHLDTQYYQMAGLLVVDRPRYPYRGIMLDVARHFIPVPTVLDVLDAMSYHKFNVMHMHLIDTESWPLVIESYPRLAGWAAYSNFSHTYSKDDIASIVDYARLRGIRVIPEIDTPAHSDIIKKAYPQFLTLCDCDGNDCAKGDTFRSMPDPTNPDTWKFLTSVFTEVRDMFPDEAFHIGGDEWWPAWNSAPAVQAFMKVNNYTDVVQVYHYYERQVIDIMRQLGKKTVVAWEDIAAFPQLHQNDKYTYDDYQDVVLDVWAGWIGHGGSWQSSFEQYTSLNASVILTGPWYVDSESQHIYDSLWSQFYLVNPGNWSGTAAQQAKVLGGHVCAWDDAMNGDSANVLSLLFPVSAAVAEVLWSPEWVTVKNEAHGRMVGHRCRLVQREVPAGPIEIGYCPIEYQSAAIGPNPAADATLDKIAALQARVADLELQNGELRAILGAATSSS